MAAEALRDALEACDTEVELLDALDFGSARLGDEAAASAFTGPLAPFYDAAWNSRLLMPAERKVAPLASLVYSRLSRHLARTAPDVLACTHALPAFLSVRERARGRTRHAIAGVMTDLMPHTLWPLGADLYCASSEEAREALVSRGIRGDRVAVTGTPLRPAFDPPPDRDASREALGVSPGERLVLVVAGAGQRGPYVRLAAALPGILSSLTDAGGVRTLVITGADEGLREALARYDPARIGVLGYVTDMPRHMAAADLLVGKPGGLISAEALACRVPMLFVGPVWGQERANAELLSRRGAARWVPDIAMAGEAAASLVLEDGTLDAMRAAQDGLATIRSAQKTAEMVIELADAPRGQSGLPESYSKASSTSHSMP